MEVIYSTDQDVLGIAFKPQEVQRREGRRTRQVELGHGVRAWISDDGETLYSIEIESRASERVELDEIKLISCDRDGSSEQVTTLPER